jgi:hypothetical protein
MKKITSLFALSMLCVSCQQQQQAMPHFYKAPNLQDRSVAVQVSTETISVSWFGARTTHYPVLECLKDEMRKRGWKLVVDAENGREGEHMDNNCPAAFTIFDKESGYYQYKPNGAFHQIQRGGVNLVLVQNSTGEEVMVLRGFVKNPKETAKKVLDKIESYQAKQQ